jgi:hypothetical protein
VKEEEEEEEEEEEATAIDSFSRISLREHATSCVKVRRD